MNFQGFSHYVVLALFVTACSAAPTQPAFKGQPFVEVRGVTAEEIISRFSVNCLDGGKIVQSTSHSLTCARSMGASGGELIYRALLTEKNASNPEVMMQTAWTKTLSGAMRVTAIAWIEHQNAFGKVTRNDLNDDSTKYQIQEALEKFKLNVEASTAPATSSPR